MPTVVVAVGASLAYSSVSAWAVAAFGSVMLGAVLGGIAAYGVAALGSQVFDLGYKPVSSPLDQPDVWLTNEPSNTAALPVVYGERRMGGTIVFAEVNGSDNRYLDVVYAICEGEVDAIGSMYLNNELVPEGVEATEPEIHNVLTLSGTITQYIRVRLKVAESTAHTDSLSTESWEDLVVFADAFAGDMEVTGPGPVDGDAPLLYSASVTTYDLDDWSLPEAPQINVEVSGDIDRRGTGLDPRFGSCWDIEQYPTEANGYELILLIDVRPKHIQYDFNLTVTLEIMSAGATQYGGLVACHRHTGGDAQTADSALIANSPRWTADHRLAGVAYAYVRYTYDTNAFPRGIPTATWNIRGRKLYDPRTGLSVWSDNPALVIRDYLTNVRYGRGAPTTEVDEASFIAAANYCEQLVDDGQGNDVARWTCNGALSTDVSALDNIRRLLPSCRGWLINVSGLYKLILDAPAAATFALDVGNIARAGGWVITMGDKSTMANRVRAQFFNPALDWRSDYAVADSPGLRELDRGLVLEQEIQLEMTNNAPEAYRHAAIALNASRQGMVVQLPALPKAGNVIPGDVCTITHPRPGWAVKKFRLLNGLSATRGELTLTLSEYADEVYDWGTIPVYDPAPNSTLPSPTVVGTPGQPTAYEELYSTRDGAGVKVLLRVSWAPSDDAYVTEYQLEAKGPDLLDGWQLVERTAGAEATIMDAAPGTWLFRVVAVNSLGVRSQPSPICVIEVQGLLDPPATPSGFSVVPISGLAVLTWEPAVDLDVRIGGSFRLRHAPLSVTSPTWDNGMEVGIAIAGTATQVVVPALPGTYFLKAIDSSGVASPTPASVVIDDAGLWEMVQVGTWSAATAWTGTHADTEVSSGFLRLVESGGVVGATVGTWSATTYLTLAAAARVRLLVDLQMAAYNAQDDVDDRTGLIDEWKDFDGAVGEAASAEVWVSIYDGGTSTWGDYQRLVAADVYGQQFRFRVVLRSSGPAYNVAVTELTVTAEEVV